MSEPEVVGLNGVACVAAAASAISILGPSLGAYVIATGIACNIVALSGISGVGVLV